MEFEASYEFAVSRRLPWGDEIDSLDRHVGAVVERLEACDAVERISWDATRDSSRLSLRFVIVGGSRHAAEADARGAVGSAIRECGAYHEGLFSADEELRMAPRLSTWSGLRTPTWQVRRTGFILRGVEEKAGAAAR